MAKAPDRSRVRGLYAITPDGLTDAALLHYAQAVLAGGARLLQYRDKISAAAEHPNRLHALRELTHAHDCLLIVNDDPLLARVCNADGVHLGREDGDLATVRKAYPQLLVGASCYGDLTLALSHQRAGADYLAFGAVAASPTKPRAALADWSLFAQLRPLGLPLVAIGGVTLQNAAALLTAGADALAVVSALHATGDIQRMAAQFTALCEAHLAQPQKAYFPVSGDPA